MTFEEIKPHRWYKVFGNEFVDFIYWFEVDPQVATGYYSFHLSGGLWQFFNNAQLLKSREHDYLDVTEQFQSKLNYTCETDMLDWVRIFL
jgi:hypothetical protein